MDRMFALIVLLAAAPCGHAWADGPLGPAFFAADGAVLEDPATGTPAGAEVIVVVFGGDDAQRLVRAELGGPAAGGAPARALLVRDGAPPQAGTVGIALDAAGTACTVADGRASCTLAAEPHPLSFRLCASAEGLHLTAWTGEPLAGERRWHAYRYLGYDLEPDCTDRDYAG